MQKVGGQIWWGKQQKCIYHNVMEKLIKCVTDFSDTLNEGLTENFMFLNLSVKISNSLLFPPSHFLYRSISYKANGYRLELYFYFT